MIKSAKQTEVVKLGAVHQICQRPKGGTRVWEMRTLADEGGGVFAPFMWYSFFEACIEGKSANFAQITRV